MVDIAKATECKARGNAAFTKGDFETAVTEFTAAIGFNPNDHVFFSNRSGAYASLKHFDKALEDADACIAIKPEWAKGYGRKGLALVSLGQNEEAKAAYSKGVEIDGNAACAQGLKDVESAMSRPKMEQTGTNPMGELFNDSMWGKLQADPTTAEYLKDPSFVQKMKSMQGNPQMMMSGMGKDPQLSAALGVLLGLGSQGFSSMNPGDMKDMGDDEDDMPMPDAPKAAAPAPKKMEVEEEEDVEEEEIDVELEAEKKERAAAAAAAAKNAAAAVAKKDEGNVFYKKKQFTEALACYDKAIEMDPENIAFRTNKAAVYFETKEYEQCIQTCKSAIEEAKAKGGYDYKVVAKAFNRMGNAFERMDKLTEALEAQKNAVLEDPLPSAQLAIKKLGRKIKDAEDKAYLSEEKSVEAKERGNECFKAQKWQEAIGEYTEALKRNPENYKVYSNRAACYTKLMDWQRGLQDCDACLERDPSFVKAYIRKGKIQHFLKQYHKAIATYQKGLDLDPTASELIEGKRITMNAINQENQSGKVDPERQAEAMKDPEIRGILADPTVQKALQDMQNDPAAGQRAMQDPVMMGKIEKLIAAGILQVGSQ